jgi:hypothetical protein
MLELRFPLRLGNRWPSSGLMDYEVQSVESLDTPMGLLRGCAKVLGKPVKVGNYWWSDQTDFEGWVHPQLGFLSVKLTTTPAYSAKRLMKSWQLIQVRP